MELADVLNDDVKEQPAPESPPAEVTETTEPQEPKVSRRKAWQAKEQAAKDAGKQEPEEKPEAKPEPPKPPEQEMTAKERAAFKKASDEAHKRQRAEQELAQVRAQLAAQQKPPEPVEFFKDPDAVLNSFRQEIKGVATTTRLNTAEMIARSKYEDFDEKVNVFAQIIQQAPQLWQQALNSPDPAEFAYRMGKNHIEIQQVGSIDSLRAKIEKETRLKVEQELKDKQAKEQELRDGLPPSLSEVRGVQHSRPKWNGPTPLDSILGK